MIGNLDIVILQQIWWIICSVVGALFLFLTFVQGGQTLLWQVAKSDQEKSLVINSLGQKMGADFYHSGSVWRCSVCGFSKVLCDQFWWGILGVDVDSFYLYCPGGKL